MEFVKLAKGSAECKNCGCDLYAIILMMYFFLFLSSPVRLIAF
jgi:hypothetical protein